MAASTAAKVAAGMTPSAKLAALRSAFLSAGPGASAIHAFVIPTDDAHSSEYVSAHDERRKWISHFTGSAGTAVVTAQHAKLWTDGRYFLQANNELPEGWELMKDRLPGTVAIDAWLASELTSGSCVGVDPATVSASTADAWAATLAAKNITLVPVQKNPVDVLWSSDSPPQPALPAAPVRVHPVALSGCSAAAKLADLRAAMQTAGAAACVVSALDEVAWLLNIRGGDISFNPVVTAYALVTQESLVLYMDDSRISPAVKAYLTGIDYNPPAPSSGGAVVPGASADTDGAELLTTSDESPRALIRPYTDVFDGVAAAAGAGKVWLDSASANFALGLAVPAEQQIVKRSPVCLAKAIKNDTELSGFRACHVRDGAALTRWLCWLEGQVGMARADAEQRVSAGTPAEDAFPAASAAAGLTEATVADKLREFRSAVPGFVSLSFDTISGSGPNGAIIHYHATPEIAAPIDGNAMYLVDSGAQYLVRFVCPLHFRALSHSSLQDGTTDVTRTIHFGTPSDYEKMCYTRVLKAHIAMDTAVFPEGWSGGAVDGITRAPLWEAGLEYMHGTGHGVGHFLNVHEGPQSVSFRPNSYTGGLKVGMTMTDEPGYYEDGKFGIRIENVCVVVRAAKDVKPRGGAATFEHITCAPITTRLVDVTLLNDKELQWLNAYNAWVRETLKPVLLAQGDTATAAYLDGETQPLARAPGTGCAADVYAPAAAERRGAASQV